MPAHDPLLPLKHGRYLVDVEVTIEGSEKRASDDGKGRSNMGDREGYSARDFAIHCATVLVSERLIAVARREWEIHGKTTGLDWYDVLIELNKVAEALVVRGL